ncbi:Hypothetical_protein [Hexamita inflata]|uniref:Hypothetical_protein n=1 Tax=Hexamita inflata TaxID=28002 RepID=A0AA86Q2U1_9EUKA|nr:Hypothetical protein HINF_LOCUS38780 [Hexamita inflata]
MKAQTLNQITNETLAFIRYFGPNYKLIFEDFTQFQIKIRQIDCALFLKQIGFQQHGNVINQMEVMWLDNTFSHFNQKKADLNSFASDLKTVLQINICKLLQPGPFIYMKMNVNKTSQIHTSLLIKEVNERLMEEIQPVQQTVQNLAQTVNPIQPEKYKELNNIKSVQIQEQTVQPDQKQIVNPIQLQQQRDFELKSINSVKQVLEPNQNVNQTANPIQEQNESIKRVLEQNSVQMLITKFLKRTAVDSPPHKVTEKVLKFSPIKTIQGQKDQSQTEQINQLKELIKRKKEQMIVQDNNAQYLFESADQIHFQKEPIYQQSQQEKQKEKQESVQHTFDNLPQNFTQTEIKTVSVQIIQQKQPSATISLPSDTVTESLSSIFPSTSIVSSINSSNDKNYVMKVTNFDHMLTTQAEVQNFFDYFAPQLSFQEITDMINKRQKLVKNELKWSKLQLKMESIVMNEQLKLSKISERQLQLNKSIKTCYLSNQVRETLINKRFNLMQQIQDADRAKSDSSDLTQQLKQLNYFINLQPDFRIGDKIIILKSKYVQFMKDNQLSPILLLENEISHTKILSTSSPQFSSQNSQTQLSFTNQLNTIETAIGSFYVAQNIPYQQFIFNDHQMKQFHPNQIVLYPEYISDFQVQFKQGNIQHRFPYFYQINEQIIQNQNVFTTKSYNSILPIKINNFDQIFLSFQLKQIQKFNTLKGDLILDLINSAFFAQFDTEVFDENNQEQLKWMSALVKFYENYTDG